MPQLGEGNLVTGWIIVALLGVMTVAVLLQPYLILFEELKRRGKPWTLENICSRINIYQLALSLSCVFYLYSIRRLFLENEESESNDLKVYSATSLGLCESFYVLFSWTRSSELVKSQVSSKFATALKYTVHIAPLLYISPGVFLLLKWQKAHNIGLVLNGVLTLTLDGVFATRFLRQMLELRNVNISVPEEFKIISFYGLLSCLFCCLCVACFAATLLVNPIPDSHALPQNAPVAFYITYNLLLVFLVLVVSTALVMKWRLGHPAMFARESVQSLVRDFLSEKDGAVRSRNPL
ncbi:hypothetical protein HDU78_005519 [Chytriomyces hyalinus]|nr:hypothetical protein HDU78_005519 [Chytriomyces hyalinus]KAJ3250989.1 hypothetical protein HDU77_006200 [Chytriomyces hyalinus]